MCVVIWDDYDMIIDDQWSAICRTRAWLTSSSSCRKLRKSTLYQDWDARNQDQDQGAHWISLGIHIGSNSGNWNQDQDQGALRIRIRMLGIRIRMHIGSGLGVRITILGTSSRRRGVICLINSSQRRLQCHTHNINKFEWHALSSRE